jgi:anti-sigma regulatory factor (Ser/Thr protein kinase)
LKQFKSTFPAKNEALNLVKNSVEKFAKKNNLQLKTFFNLNLIIEEIVVNICSYSYPENKEGDFTIEISLQDNEIEITFIDNGIPFNPSAKDVSFADNLSDASIGGLGIHIVKKISKSLEYKYENNQNILKIVLERLT